MQKIIEFVTKKGHWLLLIFFEVVAFALLFNGNIYHRFINLTYSNYIVGSFLRVSGDLTSYIKLRQKNEALLEQNARLESKYLSLKQQVEYVTADTVVPFSFVTDSLTSFSSLEYITARVISSSINKTNNLIVIDKGERAGVQKDMGVMSAHGVVGIVSSVSQDYSVIVPLINPTIKLSCKLQNTGHFGYLSWNEPGKSITRLTDLPNHVAYKSGDTIVTSGYSSVFPPNLFVGTVGRIGQPTDGVPLSTSFIPVVLGTDFATLDFVYVISGGVGLPQRELDSLLRPRDL
ncbi:rod shape-determining protein MreC [Porphyromonas circumdentaria]|uniref:Cell shape-determining protein MreC n=1 Tax=Porphyromonas circumdentaria TaxID=29524 RepID=A0A1T4NEY5_9PORP|nr:rod shape-determining protein MreC [Porphyromonas circumdentaria]MBB6275664.1 rod shape-determining protein MreC [Porphyromonas circumdentaria]MDO4721903.1 rod shape-determining protein MreC [Porphyromonas circumdentaria]SJZ77822.1 rod shape-determining protein MreC [Porphyromonas circumdentaria]